MPRPCPVYDHVADFGGPRIASQKLYPTKREFIFALWESGEHEANSYFLIGYSPDWNNGAGDVLTIDEAEIEEEWVRGCVCDWGAGELLSCEDYNAGKRFHWEAGTKPTRKQWGMIKCWRYGDWC